MTICQDISRSLAPELARLNARIRQVLASPNPLMNTVIDSYLTTKGKQIRPILVMLTARLLRPQEPQVNPRVIESAVAVELLHNATLIHDDVVDDALTRRNAATINARWDNHLAVLVGDFFLSNALRSSVATGSLDIVGAISALGRELSIGELDQINGAHYRATDEEAYLRIIYRKTASLFCTCVEVGAYAVDASEQQRHDLCEFARLLGLAFQIRDDIFDYFSDPRVGKPTGNDLREGKVTLPLLHALADTQAPEHDAMVALARKEQLLPQEIDQLIAFAIQRRGIDYAYSRMEQMRQQAVNLLMQKFPDTPQRQAFISLLDYIIRRDF